jgi:hypothetical protein
LIARVHCRSAAIAFGSFISSTRNSVAYNMMLGLEFASDIGEANLIGVINRLVDRHQILRTRFIVDAHGIRSST